MKAVESTVRAEAEKGKGLNMRRIIKFLFFLAVFGFIGLVGFAYLGNLTPETQEIQVPVTLDAE